LERPCSNACSNALKFAGVHRRLRTSPQASHLQEPDFSELVRTAWRTLTRKGSQVQILHRPPLQIAGQRLVSAHAERASGESNVATHVATRSILRVVQRVGPMRRKVLTCGDASRAGAPLSRNEAQRKQSSQSVLSARALSELVCKMPPHDMLWLNFDREIVMTYA